VTKGDIPLRIGWYFDGRPVGPHLGVTTNNIGSRANFLMIPEVQPHHRGRYICVVTNSAGSAEFSADLLVNGWRRSKSLCLHLCTHLIFCLFITHSTHS
jgi:Down syndrome cell adhesion molecule-like protein 1